MKTTRIILYILAAISIVVYFFLKQTETALEKQPQVISHGVADIGGPFELIDTNGNIITDYSLHGQYVLIYFGYTHCPDVCPIDMNRISIALEMVEKNIDIRGKIQPVFITVDPKRDTFQVIGEFLTQYHPSFIGLTGTSLQIEKLASDYKVYIEEILSTEHEEKHNLASVKTQHKKSTGLINHTSYFYLMGPDGNYVTHFDANLSPTDLANILVQYLEDL